MPAATKTFTNIIPQYRRKKGCNGQEAIKIQDRQNTITIGFDVNCDPSLYSQPYLNASIAYRVDLQPFLGPGRNVIGYRQTQRQQQVNVSYYEDCEDSIPDLNFETFRDLINPSCAADIPPTVSAHASQETYNYSFDRNVGLFVVRRTKIQIEFILDVDCSVPENVLTQVQGSISFASGEVNQTCQYTTIIPNPA